MKEKASFSTILKYVILCLLVFIYVLPLLWVVFVSLKTNTEVIQAPWAVPEALHFENYASAWVARRSGKSHTELCYCVYRYLGTEYFYRSHGILFHFCDAVETFWKSAGNVPHGNDGAGALHSDTTLCGICKTENDRYLFEHDSSVCGICPAVHHLPDEWIFQKHSLGSV